MNQPGDYRIEWSIEWFGESVIDAARSAFVILGDPQTRKTFIVTELTDGGRYEVDLSSGGSLKNAPPEKRYLLVDGRTPIGLYSDAHKAKGPYTDVEWRWIDGLRCWETHRNGERLNIYEMDVDV